MGSSSCKIMLKSTTFAAVSVILTVDAQHFTYPQKSHGYDKHASRLGHVDFTFAYVVPNKNQIGGLYCGYDYSFFIHKKRTRRAIVKQKEYIGKAEIVKDISGTSLTLRLKNLQIKDSRNFLRCLLTYSGLPYWSGAYHLKVYEPPRIIQCMVEGIADIVKKNYFEVLEGGTLSTTCIVYGDPKPFLQCYLLNKYGKVDNGQITSKDKRNFTKEVGKRLEFHNVNRTVAKIECKIDGGYYARKTMYWAAVVVGYRPGPPTKVKAVEITSTSIKLRWAAPRDNGKSKIIEFHVAIKHPNGTRIVRKARDFEFESTFNNLKKDTSYEISISASNRAGQGEVHKATFKTRSAGFGKQLSTVVLAGIGIGGFIAIAVLIIVVVIVVKRRRQAAAASRPAGAENESGSTAQDRKREREKREQEKKEKEKEWREKRKKRRKEKAEKPDDPPRKTIFGRTVKEPEDKTDGKATESNVKK